MNSDKFAVFLDIDNTLMSGGIIPQINKEKIAEVRSLGHYVFINTARSYCFIPDILKEEGLFDGYVAGIGTDLRLHGRQIFSKTLSEDELRLIGAHFLNDTREISFEGENEMIWINPTPRRNAVHILSDISQFDSDYKDFRISKMYVQGKLNEEDCRVFGEKYILYQHEYYAEFVTKGFGKAVGMKKMLEYISVPAERCIAMGDSSNDTDMLKEAGISVAMGNAIPEIKEICTYTSCDAKDGGVAEALEKLIILRTGL